MGYTHYFKKIKDIPDTQWKTLCAKVEQVFLHLPLQVPPGCNYELGDLIICDGLGKKKITDPKQLISRKKRIRRIIFNGDESSGLDYETFSLRQNGEQECCEWFCKTARKPYDFFVVSVLILLHNICPDCYEISSDGDEEWLPVVQWLNKTLDHEYVIPLSVFNSNL